MKIKLTFAAAVCAFFACSCTVQTSIRIHDDGSGSADITVILNPVAVRYMTDITSSIGVGAATDVVAGAGTDGAEVIGPFDVEAIRRSFLARPGVELESIETSGKNTLHLKAVFDDVRTLLGPPGNDTAPAAPPQDATPVTYAAGPQGHTLTITLNRTNFYRISSLFVLPDSPLTVLFPYAETDFMPRDEYLEVLEYALEDYLDGMSVEEFVKDAGVYAEVEADSPVTAATGGEVSAGRAEFFIPIIDLVTLEQGIEYALTW